MSRPPTIVVVQSNGQLGNRLEQFSHLIAFAKDHGCRISDLAFSKYSRFFAGTRGNLLLSWPWSRAIRGPQLIQRLIYFLGRITKRAGLLRFIPGSVVVMNPWEGMEFDLADPKFVDITKSKKWIFLIGSWKHRYWKNYEAHLGLIREHFALVPEIAARVKTRFSPVRKAGDVVVGVHIRQGDNFTQPVPWGAFSTAQYLDVMRRIPGLFPGKKVVFLVCSNLNQKDENFSGFTVFRGPGDFIGDMYSLAECDYICGAGESSFSGWASLMGRKPRYGLFDPDKKITLDDFVVCKGLKD